MLAQTNMQLYRQLIELAHDDTLLESVRAAYDLSRQLFAGCYRPSHKPFSAHLIGTASALAAWGERGEMIVAGLLHSTYLFGDFGDGTRGVTDARRQLVRSRIGCQAEALVEQYTRASRDVPLDGPAERPSACDFHRDVTVLKLADLCDECVDAGPCYSPCKPLLFGLPANLAARKQVTELAFELVGPAAVEHFRRVFCEIDCTTLPGQLINTDRAFHAVGSPEAKVGRFSLRRRLNRLASRIVGSRAA